jgi:hypothetical protein
MTPSCPIDERRGITSEARNQLLARSDPLFGYYFAPVWGTIVLMARPGKPQFSSGRIFTESSNPSPSSGESRANLSSSECRRGGRPRYGLRDPYEEDARGVAPCRMTPSRRFRPFAGRHQTTQFDPNRTAQKSTFGPATRPLTIPFWPFLMQATVTVPAIRPALQHLRIVEQIRGQLIHNPPSPLARGRTPRTSCAGRRR